MSLPKILLLLSAMSVVAITGVAFVVSHAREQKRLGESGGASAGAQAARDLLRSLDEQQRKQAALPFEAPERTRWSYVPKDRPGVPLARLSAPQQALLDPLLKSALSAEGFSKAKSIVAHEAILRDLEREQGVFNWRRRDSGLFFTTLFGEPTPKAPWAWRFEGHHLSVNVTHLEGHTQIVAPLFMGSNPARVPSGPQTGLRILAAEEDLARELVRALPAERRSRAIISDRTFSDIVSRNDPKVHGIDLQGLPADEMSSNEQQLLRRLVELYAHRMTHAAAQEQLERIERAGFSKLHFAWAGGVDPGEPHYYRIHGPTVLIEYDNTQNDANHIHSVWRDLERDFGGDALRAHYRRHRHDRGHAHTHE